MTSITKKKSPKNYYKINFNVPRWSLSAILGIVFACFLTSLIVFNIYAKRLERVVSGA